MRRNSRRVQRESTCQREDLGIRSFDGTSGNVGDLKVERPRKLGRRDNWDTERSGSSRGGLENL